MSSLQALLNPMSSDPPTPVALVGENLYTSEDTGLDSGRDDTPEPHAPNPVVEHVGGLVEELQVEDANHDDEDHDVDMNGVEVEEEHGVRVDDEEGYRSPSLRETTPPPDVDSMETESDQPSRGDSSPPDDSESEAYVNGIVGSDHDQDGAATETETDTPVTDREGSVVLLPPRKVPVLNTPKHEASEEPVLGSPSYNTPPAQAALVLTPSPPPEDTYIEPPPETTAYNVSSKPKSKKKLAVAKKKGQAKPIASKKRNTQDEEHPADVESPKKKTKSAPKHKGLKPIGSSSAVGITNSAGLPKYDKDGRELYCFCHKPDTGKWMIGCDGCEDWYHGECVKVKEEDGNLIDKYYCKYCSSPTQQTTWKRMCRLPGCRRPAAISKTPPSKYCTTAHGIEFMSRYVVSRSTLTCGEIATLANAVTSATEFKQLGDRIPTPPPSSTHPYPEESMRLSEIASERAVLEGRKRRIEQRAKYIVLAQERKNRVLDEFKNDPEMGKVSTICGYDERLALDDVEWDEWCAGEEGGVVFESGEILGRDGVCVKKGCRGHRGWTVLFAEEQVVMERLRMERLVVLRQEERKIRERQKRRAVKDGREGAVEVEC